MRSMQKQLSPVSQSLNFVARKIEDKRVELENRALAKRMMELPAVIQKKKLESDFQKQKELGDRIKRFHVLKKKKEPENSSGPRQFDYTLYDEEIDENNKGLMD